MFRRSAVALLLTGTCLLAVSKGEQNETQVLYDATGLNAPNYFVVDCGDPEAINGNGWLELYCDADWGGLTSNVFDVVEGVPLLGLSDCFDNAKGCVLGCNPICTCEIATKADTTNSSNFVLTGEPCPTMDLTEAPFTAPTVGPTSAGAAEWPSMTVGFVATLIAASAW
jgi:hypothetical protein